MTNADRIEIESDERGFELHVWVDEEPRVHDSGLMVLNIQNIDLDAFYDQVKARIGPYLRERDEARRTLPTAVHADSEAYDLSDPKHPDWHSVHADLYDSREGK
jgi:predicted metal-dependent phosphoesterase TrpH